MTTVPPDPFEEGGLPAFAARLRAGEVAAEEAIEACLDRIEALEPHLNAFEHVARAEALATARALDRALAVGFDPGPLMGVPIAVKDLLAVDGMPASTGSWPPPAPSPPRPCPRSTIRTSTAAWRP